MPDAVATLPNRYSTGSPWPSQRLGALRQDAQTSSKGVRPIGNGLIVFDVYHNRYRVVAEVNYGNQQLKVLFVGNHSEYERAIARGVWR